MFEEEYRLDFFRTRGYARHTCPICGKPFWSAGDGKSCGEAPCVEYGFIGSPVMDKKLSLHDMREHIISYFVRNGHTRIGRYPIVARWRDDVFFTQASIYDFQPLVTAGEDDPPANPLIVSQPCVRFNDIDNVGRTGRHMTMFEMLGHHVFNSPNKFVYWKEEAVSYCHDFLTKEVGIPEGKIIYKEKPWFGGGNAGPSLEVVVEGLELATLVFMNLKSDPKGEITLDDGTRYSGMAMRVVDPGWGLERFTWMSQASPSAYEAVFGPVLENLKNELGLSPDEKVLSEFSRIAGMMNIETSADIRLLRERVAQRLGISVEKLEKEIIPMENLYIICDHTRALMFILNDGVVPSNVKAGYYARLLVRRAIPAMNTLGLKMPLRDIIDRQIRFFGSDFPELVENRDDIMKLVDWEERQYGEVFKNTKRNVMHVVKSRKGIDIGAMDFLTEEGRTQFTKLLDSGVWKELYTSHGTTFDMVRGRGDFYKVPDDIQKMKFTDESEKAVPAGKKEDAIHLPGGLKPTELAYYVEERTKFFTAIVMYAAGNIVVLEKTYFYPEGGGEESDTGTIGGVRVKSVKKVGNVVVHVMDGTSLGFTRWQKVDCEVDWGRRRQLVAHHTATHIINGVAREILGNHVWQAGAYKGADGARLDITHYTGLTPDELAAMEKRGNDIVAKNITIDKSFMERSAAEKKYSFRLYQGGAAPGKKIRVVNIGDWDVEACGGTHADSTGEVGRIIITGTKRIQQGVVRIEFVAGAAAEKYQADALKKDTMAKGEKPIPKQITQQEIDARVDGMLEKAENFGSVRIISCRITDEIPAATGMIRALTKRGNVISVIGSTASGRATILIARSQEPGVDKIDASSVLKHVLPLIGGAGGGRADFAQGGGNRADALGEAVDAAFAMIKRILEGE